VRAEPSSRPFASEAGRTQGILQFSPGILDDATAKQGLYLRALGAEFPVFETGNEIEQGRADESLEQGRTTVSWLPEAPMSGSGSKIVDASRDRQDHDGFRQ
jgi:hypothetical protein